MFHHFSYNKVFNGQVESGPYFQLGLRYQHKRSFSRGMLKRSSWSLAIIFHSFSFTSLLIRCLRLPFGKLNYYNKSLELDKKYNFSDSSLFYNEFYFDPLQFKHPKVLFLFIVNFYILIGKIEHFFHDSFNLFKYYFAKKIYI